MVYSCGTTSDAQPRAVPVSRRKTEEHTPELEVRRHKPLAGVVVALLIASLAGFLRIRHLDTTGMWGDQAFLLNTTMRWINGGSMPLAANKSSIGVMHGPMIQYLYAIALLVWRDVLSVAVLTALSGTLAVGVTAWVACKTFGKKTAYISALLFAVSPWSVFYSQLIWNPTMVPLFSTLALGCLLLYFCHEQRPAYLIVSIASMAIMTQLHPGTAVQLVTLLIACLLFRDKVRLWPLAVGGIVFALVHLPFVLYHWSVAGRDLLDIFQVAQQPIPLSPASLLVSFDLVKARGLLGSVRYVSTFDALADILLGLSLVYATWSALRALSLRRRDPTVAARLPALVILLLWFALPILFYLRSPHYLQTHYLIGQLPAHFLLIGSASASFARDLEMLASRVQGRAASPEVRLAVWPLALVPLFALVGWQSVFNIRFQDHRYNTSSGPTQIRHFREAIRSSKRLLGDHPACELVALAPGHSVETSELSLLRGFVSEDRVLLADGRIAAPVPASCAIYLDTQGTSRASGWLEKTTKLLPSETVRVLAGQWEFYSLPHDGCGEERAGVPRDISNPEWTKGLMLVGHERRDTEPGTTLPLTLTWRITDPVPNTIYHFGTYLLTADDQLVAQTDGPGFDSIQWRAGDSFITWFDILVPESLEPGRYRIGVALYSWPDIQRAQLKGGGSTAFLDDIQIGAP